MAKPGAWGRKESSASDQCQRDRGITNLIGLIIIVAITVIFASVAAQVWFDIQGASETGSVASLSFTVDATDDKIRIQHQAGETLYADRTRFRWEIAGTTYRSNATDTHEGIVSGERTVFTFDGTTNTTGAWSSYPSPGSADIRLNDTITVYVYDTESGTQILSETFTAEEVRGDI